MLVTVCSDHVTYAFQSRSASDHIQILKYKNAFSLIKLDWRIVLFYLSFLLHSWITRQQGTGRPFLPPLRHLDIRWAITAGSSPLHIASDPT